MKGMNIDRDCLEMIECLGPGCVADVWLAYFTVDPLLKMDKSQVAVKMLRGKAILHSSQLMLSVLNTYYIPLILCM